MRRSSQLHALLAIAGALALSPRSVRRRPALITPSPSLEPKQPDYEPVSAEAKAAAVSDTTEYGSASLLPLLAQRVADQASPQTQAELYDAARRKRERRAARKNPSAYSVRNAQSS